MSEIRIVKYDDSKSEEWESFVDRSINGTIFHRQKFIDYHPKDRFDDCSLMFYEKLRLIAVFPGAKIEKHGKLVLKSHPGTSYGGLVFDSLIPIRKIFKVLKELDDFCRENEIQKIEFRQAPKIYNRVSIDQFDYALVRNGYLREDEELSTYFPISEYQDSDVFEEYIMQFPQKNRNEIRKGKKSGLVGKVIDKEEDIESFYKMLERNLEEKFDKSPTHAYSELLEILNSFRNENFIYGIFHEDKLTAGFLVMSINRENWHIFYAPLDYDYQIHRPLNFGVASLIKHAIDNKIKHLNYGISTEDGGRHVNWHLFRFKENFNGSGILRTYWIKELG